MKGAQAAKERPILFSRPMVAALARGEKTQTRRVIKPQLPPDGNFVPHTEPGVYEIQAPGLNLLCHHGAVGDRLWVREPWRVVVDDGGAFVAYSDGEEMSFPANDDDLRALAAQRNGTRNRHARYMPRWASRFLLEIVGIRVERVQEISEEDARAEGVTPRMALGRLSMEEPAKSVFMDLWDSIHGPGAWKRNEWVWVVEFRRVDVAGGEP